MLGHDRNGRKRPGPGRRQSGRILDQQVLPVAWPQDKGWWQPSWQLPPHEYASEGITIQITKKAEATGALNIYLFVAMDAQLNIEDGQFVSAAY